MSPSHCFRSSPQATHGLVTQSMAPSPPTKPQNTTRQPLFVQAPSSSSAISAHHSPTPWAPSAGVRASKQASDGTLANAAQAIPKVARTRSADASRNLRRRAKRISKWDCRHHRLHLCSPLECMTTDRVRAHRLRLRRCRHMTITKPQRTKNRPENDLMWASVQHLTTGAHS